MVLFAHRSAPCVSSLGPCPVRRSELSVAMQNKVGLGALAGVIHPYPTRAESIRQAGDLYNKTKLTPLVRSLFRNLMAIKR